MRYKFTLEKRKKDGIVIVQNVPIRITVNHNKQRITLSTGYRIDQKAWNPDRQQVKQGHYNKLGEPYNIINAKLAEQTSFLDRFYIKHQNEDLVINLENLKSRFASYFSRKKGVSHSDENKELSFFELFDQFTDERGKQNDWTKATYTKFSTVKSHLLNFDKNLSFESIDEEKLTDYILYLRNVADMKKQHYKKTDRLPEVVLELGC